jgi:hypothetical protein
LAEAKSSSALQELWELTETVSSELHEAWLLKEAVSLALQVALAL